MFLPLRFGILEFEATLGVAAAVVVVVFCFGFSTLSALLDLRFAAFTGLLITSPPSVLRSASLPAKPGRPGAVLGRDSVPIVGALNSGRFGFVAVGFAVLTILGGAGTFGCGCSREGVLEGDSRGVEIKWKGAGHQ
eukprot:sb/3474671/